MPDDEKATEFFEHMRWLPPVDTLEQLAEQDAREGHLCFVSAESAVYRYQDGEWRLEASAE